MLFCFTVACSSAHIYTYPILDRSDRSQVITAAVAAQNLRTGRAQVRGSATTTIQLRWMPPLGVASNGVALGTVDVAHPTCLPARHTARRL
jgi:hypothetical protein